MFVKMPAEMKAKWLEALRSGEYKQGHGSLQNNFGGHCCLGVLQKAVTGQCEKLGPNYTNYAVVPSDEWYEANGVFMNRGGTLTESDKTELTLIAMNDGMGSLLPEGMPDRCYSFSEIADFIEKNVGVTNA